MLAMAGRVCFVVARRGCPACRLVFRVPWWWPLAGRRGWAAWCRFHAVASFLRVWGVPLFGLLAFLALASLALLVWLA